MLFIYSTLAHKECWDSLATKVTGLHNAWSRNLLQFPAGHEIFIHKYTDFLSSTNIRLSYTNFRKRQTYKQSMHFIFVRSQT